MGERATQIEKEKLAISFRNVWKPSSSLGLCGHFLFRVIFFFFFFVFAPGPESELFFYLAFRVKEKQLFCR